MSTSTIQGFLDTATASLSTTVEHIIPVALGLGIGIFAVFLGWKLVKRFVK